MVWAEVPNVRHEVELPSASHVVSQAPSGRYLVPDDELPWWMERIPSSNVQFLIEAVLSAQVKPTALIVANQSFEIDITAATATVLRPNVAIAVTMAAAVKAVLARTGSVAADVTVSAISRAVVRPSFSASVSLSTVTKPIAYVEAAFVIDIEVGDAIPKRIAAFAPEVSIAAANKKVHTAAVALTTDVSMTATAKAVKAVTAAVGVGVTVSAINAKISSSLAAVRFDVAATGAVKKVVSSAAPATIDAALAATSKQVYSRSVAVGLEVVLSAVTEVVTFSNMGMDKSGTWNGGVGNNWTDIPGFVVRSGFPSTVLSGGNGLVMNGSKSITVTWDISANNVGNTTYRITKNGVVVQTFAQGVRAATSSAFNVVAGDILKIQYNPFFGNTQVTAGYMYTNTN